MSAGDSELTYHLGVDLGTTYSSVALVRGLRAETVVLGHRSALLPSAIWLGPAGDVLVGEPALRRGQREPEGLVREFKRRLGDSVPFMVRGAPVSAAHLTSTLMASIIEQVVSREGAHPTRVAVTHPANWGPHRLDIFREAVRSAGVTDAILLSEPEAAALYYASVGRVADGEIVVVYDLGGGTFDVAILQRRGDQFALHGRPDGVARLGGIDFDEVVFDYVSRAVGGLDGAGDDAWNIAVRRLHGECVDAKEALSADVVVDIAVMLPARHTEIRLPRREFEDLIRPALDLTVDAVRRALTSARLEPEDIARVLLVGGSSRIPLVAELISSNLRRGVSVDVHPKFAVVLGAAMAAASGGAIDERVTIGIASPEPVRIPVLAPDDVTDDVALPPPVTPPSPGGRKMVIIGAAALVGALLAVGAVLLMRGGSEGSSATSTTPTTGVRVGPLRIELGADPVGLAAGLGAAWAATADGQLVQLDGANGDVARRTPLAAALDDVLAGSSAVWVTGADALYRIDPATGSVTKTVQTAGTPDGIAAVRGAIWIGLTQPAGGALYRIDEGTSEARLMATFPIGVTEIAADAESMWVSSAGNVLYRVDPASGEFSSTDVGAATDGIVIAFGALWATVPSANEVLRLDPTSGRTLARIATGPVPNEIIVGDGVLWVSEQNGASVVAIDPASNAVARRVPVGAGPDRMAWIPPNLWVADSGETSLSIFPV